MICSPRSHRGLDDVLARVAPHWIASTRTSIRGSRRDFLEWLDGWVGVVIDEGGPLERSRAFIANIAELYRWRGTIRGLTAEWHLTGGDVEIARARRSVVAEPWHRSARRRPPRMAVRVSVDDPSSINAGTVDKMVPQPNQRTSSTWSKSPSAARARAKAERIPNDRLQGVRLQER